jgi:hypothetical protein
MPEQQSVEFLTFALPLLGQDPESNILGEQDPSEFCGTLEQLLIWQRGTLIFNRRQYVDTFPTQLIGDRLRNVHVHVQSRCHG